MVVLITGASHTGKTLLAQRILAERGYPYLSIDHLKMGLIRAGRTDLTPCSPDADLIALLWPIVREMVKTAIENGQNLTVEGCYIPPDWADDFDTDYLRQIRFICLAFSEDYLQRHFDDVRANACAIEQRLDDDYTLEQALSDNAAVIAAHGARCHLIRDEYALALDDLLG